MQLRCAKSVALAQFVALASVVCALGCSGSTGGRRHSAATSSPAAIALDIAKISNDAVLRRMERRVRLGANQQALEFVSEARKRGLEPPVVALHEAVALWQLKRPLDARKAETRLVRLSLAGRADSWPSVESLLAFHLHTRGNAADALGSMAPLVKGGCASPRACEIALRVLVAAAGRPLAFESVPGASQPDKAVSAIFAATPTGDAVKAMTWRLELLRELAAALKWNVADALYARLLKLAPDNADVWATGWYIARRRRGLQHRQAWFEALVAAKLSRSALDAILLTRDVSSDRLVVARILGQLCQLPASTEHHWVRWVQALAINQARGASQSPRAVLARIARNNHGRFASDSAKTALVEALLRASLPKIAGPLLAQLLQVRKEPEWLVLKAELHRQNEQPGEARKAANEAFALATDKASTAWHIASLWRRVWPVDAGRWQKKGAQIGGRPTLPRLRDQALQELELRRPGPRSETLLRAYIRRLIELGAVTAPGTTLATEPTPASQTLIAERAMTAQVPRFCDELVHILASVGAVRSAWRSAAHDNLSLISNSALATTEVHYQLARIAARANRHGSFLAAYDRAISASRASGEVLDDEGLLADVVRRGDDRLLVRWLQRSGMKEAQDLILTWNVASRLLNSPYKSIGRQWMQRVLARIGGDQAVLTARLVRHQRRTRHRVGGRSPNITPQQLARAARTGAADLVLEHLADAAHEPATARDAKTAMAIANAQIPAYLAQGDPDRATALVRALLQRRDLNALHRRQLFELIAKSNLCHATVELAIELSARREEAIYGKAIEHGASCARQLGDPKRAHALFVSVKRHQIQTDRQLRLGQVLEKNGFDQLAVQLFDGVITGSVTQHRYLASYARALLDTGRISQAEETLRSMIRQRRSRSSEYRSAAALLSAHGHHRRALLLLDEAASRHSDLNLRYDRLLLRLKTAGRDGLRTEIAAFVTKGPSEIQLKGLLNAARAANRLSLLYAAVRPILQVDRTVERFRLELAGILGLRKEVAISVRRLKDRGRVHGHSGIDRLRDVGATREARAMAEDVLASAQPSGGRLGRQRRMQVLRAAMQTRLDPSSESEALGIARLFVGRSLERARAAEIASEELDRLGFSSAAHAVASLTADPANAGAHSLCRRGVTAENAGKTAEALKLWRSAMGRLLIGDLQRRHRGEPEAIVCLVQALQRTDQSEEAVSFLEQLLDARPGDERMWALLLDVHTRNRDHPRAIAALRRAHRHANGRDTLRFMPAARRIRRDGGAARLAAWFVGDDALRSDPWWLAFVVDVLQDEAAAVGDAGKTVQRRIESLARNDPELRSYLALMWAGRGEPTRAVRWLGKAPFAHTSNTVWLRQARTSRAAAAVLITVYRAIDRGARGQQFELLELSPAGYQAVQKVVQSWRPAMSATDATLLAGELVTQGHPQIAARLLAELGGDPNLAREEHVHRQRLRVAATTATDRDLLQLVANYYNTPVAGAVRRTVQQRQRDLLRHLALAGRASVAATVARGFAKTGSTAGRSLGIVREDNPATVSGTDFSDLVRAFDPRVLDRMQAGPPVRSLADALAACDVAVAAKRPELALTWLQALSVRHDEPWRLWLRLHRGAVRFADAQTAKVALLRARRLGAPDGAVACPSLWLLRSGTIASCVANRPLALLPADDLGAVALALARGVDTVAAPPIMAALAKAPARAQVAWVGGISAHVWALDERGRKRARELVRQLIATISGAARHDTFINSALDDLAAVGVTEPGVAHTQMLLKQHPRDRFARNNASYALFLSGDKSTRSLEISVAALGTRGGQEAHALLDTIASSLYAHGNRRQATELQRWALAATRPTKALLDPSPPELEAGLPLVRLAEFELAAGNLEQARILAVLGMQRERLSAALHLQMSDPDAYAATGLPSVGLLADEVSIARRERLLQAAGLHDAGTPITMARARAVIAAVLRASRQKPQPTAGVSTKSGS